jgi:sugar lactone lactonase YvrE
MNKQLPRLSHLVVAAVLASGLSVATQVGPTRAASALASGVPEVVASGLDNPRGLSIGNNGDVYLAEAGKGGPGPCTIGQGGAQFCLGNTGAIVRIRNGQAARIVTGLPSIARADGTNAEGPAHVLQRGSNLIVAFGLLANPANRTALGAEGALLGQLVRISQNHSGSGGNNNDESANAPENWGNVRIRPIADVAGFEAANNPDGVVPDSNPFSFVRLAGKYFLNDAGGNTTLEVQNNGSIAVTALFPSRQVTSPFVPTQTIPMQAVPTGMALGEDGALYFGQLTGFPFPVGAANVYRLVPGEAPTVYAEGFTNIIDVEFDSYGNLYVLEHRRNGLRSPDTTGRLTRITPQGARQVLLTDGLTNPTALAIDKTNAIYIANKGNVPAAGEVLRFKPKFDVIASGLLNPRGLKVTANHTVFVAEAGAGGSGPCVPNPEGGEACYGPSGAIARISRNGKVARIADGLPSLAGPGGDSALGPLDVTTAGPGRLLTVIGLGQDPARRSQLGAAGPYFGTVMQINAWGYFYPQNLSVHSAAPAEEGQNEASADSMSEETPMPHHAGDYRVFADLAGFEAAANPDGEVPPDSNPVSLVWQSGKAIVSDAGGNDVVSADQRGNTSSLAVLPPRLVPNPFAPATTIPMQAVPTGVNLGPDGAIYFGQLTGFPFPKGGANVYRLVAGQAPTVYAEGFTNIIDIAFDREGRLLVLEITTNGLLSGDPTGALVRVNADGSKETLLSDGLITPGGLDVADDGTIYLSNYSTSATQGQVIRLNP